MVSPTSTVLNLGYHLIVTFTDAAKAVTKKHGETFDFSDVDDFLKYSPRAKSKFVKEFAIDVMQSLAEINKLVKQLTNDQKENFIILLQFRQESIQNSCTLDDDDFEDYFESFSFQVLEEIKNYLRVKEKVPKRKNGAELIQGGDLAAFFHFNMLNRKICSEVLNGC